MDNKKQTWTEKIATRLNVFNEKLESWLRKNQIFLENMGTEKLMQENKAYLIQLVHRDRKP